MPRNFSQIYLHFVWGTKGRNPLITDLVRDRLHSMIYKKCEELRCSCQAIGSVEDHVHLLVEFHPSISPSDFIGQIKGSSSHFLTHEVLKEPFQWQSSYGVFSISKRSVPRVRDYILNQQRHHADGTVIGELERVGDVA